MPDQSLGDFRDAVTSMGAVRVTKAVKVATIDTLAEEAPVALVYNGISHAVMMCTPTHLEDLGLGFSLTERIVTHPSEVLEIDVCQHPAGATIEMQISQRQFQALKRRRRQLIGRTGCGICGMESLEQIIPTPGKLHEITPIRAEEIHQALESLAAMQPLNAETGAVHAAGYWRNGYVAVREDVGRHNALDKLIGALSTFDRTGGFVVMTSRASYELVEKAAVAGIACIVVISAPTALAVRVAELAGVTLIGFARERRMTAYTHSDRLVA